MNMRATLSLLFFVLLISLSNLAQAQFAPETPAANRRPRNLGMGNVGIATQGAHDSSPFYNPAGLNDLTERQYQFLSPLIEIASGSLQQLQDLSSLTGDLGDAGLISDRLDLLDDFVQKNLGDFHRVRFGMDLFNYAQKNFAAGVGFDARINTSFRNPTFVNFEFRGQMDIVTYISGSHSLWDDKLQFGATLRPTIRFALDEKDQVVTFVDVIEENAAGEVILLDQLRRMKDPRFGLAADIGLKSNLEFLPWAEKGWFKSLQPSLGFVWRDIGSTGFGSAEANKQSLGVGLAAHPSLYGWPMVVGLDFVDLNQDRPVLSMLHFGVEVQTPYWVALRAGVNQGYFSAGTTIKLWVAKLEAAYYYEEIGRSVREKGNPRLALRLSFQI